MTLTILQSGDPDMIFTNHTQCPSPSSCSSTMYCTILLHTPLKHLTHEQPPQSTTLATSMLGGSSCGGACSPHLPEVSRHYKVMVNPLEPESTYEAVNFVFECWHLHARNFTPDGPIFFFFFFEKKKVSASPPAIFIHLQSIFIFL